MLPFERILCPTDLSETSYQAVEAASELALHFSAELSLLHVLTIELIISIPETGTSFSNPEYQKQLEEYAEQSLHEVVKQRVAKQLRTRVFVVIGNADSEIVRFAAEQKTDIIVLSAGRRTSWRSALFGSVSEKVVRFAPCPVLTI